MIISKENIVKSERKNDTGSTSLFMSDLAGFEGKNEKVRMFGFAELLPGQEIKYHAHAGESETYYILSGHGLYNDNGKETEIFPGSVTFTPSGNSHGMKNTGDENLNFIALILTD